MRRTFGYIEDDVFYILDETLSRRGIPCHHLSKDDLYYVLYRLDIEPPQDTEGDLVLDYLTNDYDKETLYDMDPKELKMLKYHAAWQVSGYDKYDLCKVIKEELLK